MQKQKPVIYWLLTGCLLIFIMVVVGGITRLTHAGLSISNYKLVSGTLPPMNDLEWQQAFDLYKQYPEYQKLNNHFTITDFKDIYFWEWLHRFIGRFIGMVFVIPFLYFLLTKKLNKPTVKKCILLLILGGFQGFLGWYMVKSGLIDRPDVSHFRLAAHLTTAFLTFSYSLWVALDLIYPNKKEILTAVRNTIRLAMVFLILQIIWGAFVAGLDAGLIHNHWPLMNEDKLIHQTVYIEHSSLLKNFTEGRSGVQFIHRYLAYIVVFFCALIWFKTKKHALTILQKKGLHLIIGLVGLQFILGIFTLLFAVPIWLGVAHQIGAFFLLAAMTFTLHRFSN